MPTDRELTVNATVNGLSYTILGIAQYVEDKHPGLREHLMQMLINLDATDAPDADKQFMQLVATTLGASRKKK